MPGDTDASIKVVCMIPVPLGYGWTLKVSSVVALCSNDENGAVLCATLWLGTGGASACHGPRQVTGVTACWAQGHLPHTSI
jgi:hypothetical protein